MDTMDEKLTQAPAEAAELTDEAVDEVSGGILIEWTPVDLTPMDP